MGRGLVKTRSGFDSNLQEIHQRSKCKAALRFIVELLRDLILLCWYTLPGPATNLRFYCLILARMIFYGLEAMVFYAMTVTIMTGADEEDPGVLIELTRLLLCSAVQQAETRVRRETGGWQDLVSQVNGSNTELAEILRSLIGTTTLSSLDYSTNTTLETKDIATESSNTILEFFNGTTLVEMVSLSPSTIMEYFNGTTLVEMVSLSPNTTQEYFNGTTLEKTVSISSDIAFEFNNTDTIAFEFNNTDTIAADSSLGENITAMTAFLNQRYQFDWCVQIEDLDTDQTAITCISGLALPLCAVVALTLGSTACGFVLARLGRNQTEGSGKRTKVKVNPVPSRSPQRPDVNPKRQLFAL